MRIRIAFTQSTLLINRLALAQPTRSSNLHVITHFCSAIWPNLNQMTLSVGTALLDSSSPVELPRAHGGGTARFMTGLSDVVCESSRAGLVPAGQNPVGLGLESGVLTPHGTTDRSLLQIRVDSVPNGQPFVTES